MPVFNADDLAALFDTDDFGEAATYEPRDGSTTSPVTVVPFETEHGTDRENRETMRKFLIRESDITVMQPRDALVYDGHRYRVLAINPVPGRNGVLSLETKQGPA